MPGDSDSGLRHQAHAHRRARDPAPLHRRGPPGAARGHGRSGPAAADRQRPRRGSSLQPVSPEEEQLRLDWFNSRNDTDDRLDLAIVDKASGDCVGEAVLNQWDPGNQSCNFRIQIGPAGQNRGLGTEATRLIVGHGFEQLGLHRISLEVYSFNPRARRAYEKVGFRVEGVLRESLRYGDQWIDATVMSILAREWPPDGATQG